MAQLSQVGHIDEADEELALQPLWRQNECLSVRAHELLHCLRSSDRACLIIKAELIQNCRAAERQGQN